MGSVDSDYPRTDGVILHFTNGSCQFVSYSDLINSVTMISPNEGWAVGWYAHYPSITGVTILHYTNGTWQTYSSPTQQHLQAVAMLSTGDGWAVGDRVILHYQR